MNKKLFGFAGILVFAMFGCGDEGVGTADTNSAGTVTTLIPLEITDIQLPSCEGSTWVYAATTQGWTNGANIVNAWETGNDNGWNDEHPLLSDSFEEDGSADYLKTSLSSGAAVESWVGGTSTVFSCGTHDVDPVMTYAVRVYDLDGNFTECAIFATDSGGVDDVYAGSAPTWVSVTAPDEISEANCLEWTVSR